LRRKKRERGEEEKGEKEVMRWGSAKGGESLTNAAPVGRNKSVGLKYIHLRKEKMTANTIRS